MSESVDLYEFRSYVPDDIPFIQSSWGNSYYVGVSGHQQLSPEEFHSYHRPIRERALSKPNIAAIVCHAKADPSTILGWILVEKPNDLPYLTLHYLYVKASVQGNHLGSELVRMALPIRPILYTHSTTKARRIIKENWKANKEDYARWLFCPHLI